MSTASIEPVASSGKQPRTERGRRTLRKLLDAAAIEFGENGFHEASISAITRRAGTALGSFYTYFDSKDEIFRALVKDMSGMVRSHSASELREGMTAIEIEAAALKGFLGFAREHKEIYRIIDESEFVDPASYREHYESTAKRIVDRFERGMATGELRQGLGEAEAWALMGMNVFLGLRYAILAEDESIEDIAETANKILRQGITAKDKP